MNEKELVVLVSILPNIMQRMENQIEQKALRFEAKKLCNDMNKSIERFTNYLLKGMDIDALKDLELISKSFDEYLNS